MPQSPFVSRHIGPNDQDIANMLAELGYSSLNSLTEAVVPPGIQMQAPLALPDGVDEHEALQELRGFAAQNQTFRSLIGMGYYNTRVPAVIQRNVLENPGWYTAYTPYQPEIAQGRLEGLLNFQQMVCDLTGMALANASMLDEATAVAEAMAMCKRQQRKNRSQTFFVDAECHPHTLAVVRTRAEFFGFDILVGDPTTDLENIELFGAVIQYPGSTGVVRALGPIIEQIHQQGALAVVAADLMSLLLLTPPGELGADVVVGNAQRFGVPMGFGGPHAAFFAFRDEYKRSAPGRIIGVSIDSRGKTALRMAMQTREQHIRREKANSNICTSQVLLALMSAFYAVYHGPRRLRAMANRIHDLTNRLAAGLKAAGHETIHDHWFDTLCLDVGTRQSELLDTARQRGINLRAIGEDRIGISLDECSDEALLIELLEVFSATAVEGEVQSTLPSHLLRTSAYLEHPIFNSYHSETEMLRYLKRLESRDIALNQAMIPLGSCTMKLNATAEMTPITWSQFAELHPFAPAEQAMGYQCLFKDLEHWLAVCTGYDAVSLQPNAGSQGEYAGLLAIQRYHQSRGEHQRTVCLIPSSAHGTNPASAQMVGMQVVVVECDAKGNVDVDDLTKKAEQYSEQLSALMITYPSTHGVFEERIRDICDVIHRHGGQVYIDGANMNAMVGLAEPGRFGGDVSHLNLHKTFCIPHGGGGPGMGPIGVREHLAPFLPGHAVTPIDGADNQLAISAAAYGSASILPIPWMYMRMMGAAGLRRATQVAILSANYIARKLAPAYPILYSGRDGLVAHECLIDLRNLKESSGITEEDVAKRLMDFGFHAPTMSFPVAGTLMIEPTESESREELDRFIEAMLIIRDEITKVETGEWPADDNPLKHAPHTQDDVLADDWQRPYSREQAARPAPWLKGHKVWPYVNRIDNVYGDRNLVCSCPPMESYR